MKVCDIAKILEADVLCCQNKVESIDIFAACGSDMMSDVLAYVKDQGILLTGLLNAQVVRTAEMMDMSAIAFVRGKRPEQLVIDLAAEKGIVLLCTKHTMYRACGLLYVAGLDCEKRL